MLGHKISVHYIMKIEILSSIFLDHSAMKVEINYQKSCLLKSQTYRNVSKQHATV